jgi:hypothetical protein
MPHEGMLEKLWMLNCKLTNISPAVWKLWSKYEIHGSNLQRQLVTLTLSRPGWNMGSAHHLDGMNI